MKCKHSKCGKCGGIKLKSAYIGRINLKDICSPKCQNASKDACECKCRGEFHKGSNSKRMDKLLNPEKYIEKVKNSSLKNRLKKFQPETPTDFLAMFLFNTRIKTSSFDRNADKNLRKDNKKLTLTWLSNKGVPLDVLANDFINEIGLNLEEDQIIEMIIDFVVDYPSGVKTYIDEVEAERIRIDEYYKEVDIPEENLLWEDFTPINGINMATKFKKGSPAAKAFMAKLRAAKGKSKPKLKVAVKLKKGSLGAVKKATPKKSISSLNSKYYIEYMYKGIEQREYFDQIPKSRSIEKNGKYWTIAKNNITYPLMHLKNDKYVRLTDSIGKTKKAAPKKKAAVKLSHKDTGSHNVKIHVVSGFDKNMYSIRDNIEKTISQNLRLIELAKNDKSLTKPIKAKMLKSHRANLASYKKMLREQNRLINSNLK